MASSGPRRRPGFLSAVKRFVRSCLPPALHRFLCGHSSDFAVAHHVMCALFGAVSGAVVFWGIAHNLPLTFDLKVKVGVVFVVLCAVGGALSSFIRCSILLMLPSMLGSRGRDYLMLLVLTVLYTGPLSNIQRNAEGAALSLSCNLDLQVHNSKLLWRDAIRPFIRITQQLMNDQTEFQSKAQDVNRNFQRIRDEMVRRFGYDGFHTSKNEGNNTQEQFVTKTLTQCSGVVEHGMQRCADWFDRKWAECLKAIPVPIISHIFCVPMKFIFLCEVLRVMTPWCKENVPVEGNFGLLFDQLNSSVDQLTKEFTTEVHVEEEQKQEVLSDSPFDKEYTKAVKMSFINLVKTMGQVLDILQFVLSFTFIFTFIQAFNYVRNYRVDICFDNVYLTSYFRRLDAVRRRAGKFFVLPLRKSEKNKFIDPLSLKVHSKELKQVTSGLFQVFTIAILSAVMLLIDFSFFHILDIISRHTVTQFNLTSSHQVDINVGGDSMMARLLRSSISAFNSSSKFSIYTNNQECMVHPTPLSATVYISCVCCVLLAALMSWIQVYVNRLRRFIAAFFNPEIEKKRVLYLYKLQKSRRLHCKDKRRSRKTRTVFQRFNRWCCRLCQKESDQETYYAPG
ncbi:E3 ubiquitin-protein ligase DCST1 [Gouania willdenowi]|uniref:E3 ubiquitin-protein ligase DCST1 n=1 Tax=Gouania willdenowi TaxID=441366 RepID=UPI001055FE6D|nr:E3 ubiquitin-protein ligase DCST1 [Gouania willdenowi]